MAADASICGPSFIERFSDCPILEVDVLTFNRSLIPREWRYRVKSGSEMYHQGKQGTRVKHSNATEGREESGYNYDGRQKMQKRWSTETINTKKICM